MANENLITPYIQARERALEDMPEGRLNFLLDHTFNSLRKHNDAVSGERFMLELFAAYTAIEASFRAINTMKPVRYPETTFLRTTDENLQLPGLERLGRALSYAYAPEYIAGIGQPQRTTHDQLAFQLHHPDFPSQEQTLCVTPLNNEAGLLAVHQSIADTGAQKQIAA